MDLTDSMEIRAAPETVWAALFDPEVLRLCISGCESMTGNRTDGYLAVIRQKVGPIHIPVRGRLSMTDIVEGRAVTIRGEGAGGATAAATGSARVTLTPSETGTTLAYTVTARVDGKIASLGSPLVDRALRRLAEQFFANLQDAVEPATAAEMAAAGPDAAPNRGWFRRMIGS